MPDKTLYGLRSTQRHKELRGIFNGGIPPKGVPHILKPERWVDSGHNNTFQWPLLLTWINFNPSMDK